ncbi:MAG TPA: Fic family protein [Thermoanaerobaculia bacterium]
MQVEDFTNPSGTITLTSEGASAFVPAPLPPQLQVSWSLTQRLAKAERALGRLAGIGKTLPNPHLLIRPFVRREAVLSSRIEGTQASATDLLLFEASGEPSSDVTDVREVANYVRALDYGRKRLAELPISLRFLREIHLKLMRGVRGDQHAPGEFRAIQNWIGPPGCSIANATYVPPAVPAMHEALDAFEKYLHAKTDLPLLVRCALIHYQFEAIHPFLDGNGRVGRLLIAFLLESEHALEQPLLNLSAFFERNRRDYYELLHAVSRRSEWTDWIMFVLRGVEEQADDAIQRSDSMLLLWRTYRERVAVARTSALLAAIVDELFASPATTIARVRDRLGITYPSAKNNVDKLVDFGILTAPKDEGRNRIFVADEIIRTVEAP